MKIFTHRIFTNRKMIAIFLFAIFLPSLIVGYLSLRTFSQRRVAVKNLLESNRWISGEAALKSIEGALLDHEKKALTQDYFIRLSQTKRDSQVFANSPKFPIDHSGQHFLLDADYNIVYPETGSETIENTPWEKEISNSPFASLFQKAELFEFAQKNYTQAGKLYRECTLSAPSPQQRAAALEGLGRCLLSSRKYDEAEKIYLELSKNYGQYPNKAGHPYGIVAAFQLYEIAQKTGKDQNSLHIMLNLYKKMREGFWLVNSPAYDFYTSEIESILNTKLRDRKYPDLQKSYTEIQKIQSPYRQTLVFTDFLEQNAIPKIKEKLALNRAKGENEPERLLIPLENKFFMVSYAILPNFQSGQTFYGGFCWDPDLLKNQIMPKLLADVKNDSRLNFKIIEEADQNTDEKAESIVLTFRQFPLPWKLLVSQPEINVFEKAADREIFFYGFLLAVIGILMLLGVVLIARDITRESETTRLKTEFVHNISHELKTPLTLIRLYGETLQRKENLTSEEKKECYEIITKESERLSHLINNVLDFSRIEMGRKEFDFKKGNLADVIEDTLESYRYHLEKKGFAIHKDIARDLPEMDFDGEAIASVLINLLSNAMKFSLKEKEVTVKLFQDDGNAVIQVTDKGVGIPSKDVSKIFQRFYQSENKLVSERRGSGIGLTLVKHITEAHNGRVQVESEPGKGSTFSVILPISNT